MKPTNNDVKAIRLMIQRREDLAITAAQDYCAGALQVNRRTWQRWEEGSRGMSASNWELANIKLLGGA